jgi:hypothetical protein
MELQEPIPVRRLACSMLILVAAGLLAGRILAVERVYEPSVSRGPQEPVTGWRMPWPSEKPQPTPTFSSNDRSRWATVRSLVDEGHYWIGYREEVNKSPGFIDHGFIFDEFHWFTIDRVLDPETHRFYSSKPPLLPTLMAGEYWLEKKLFGWDLATHPWPVVLVGLFTANWLPLVIYLVLLARLVEQFGQTDWGRMFVVAAACFGTMLTPFAITFNNHTVAACSALFALYPVLRGDSWYRFALAGFLAGFAACCELPAAAFLVALGVVLLIQSPVRTLLCFVPAAVIPIAGMLATNYLAIGSLTPVYSKLDSPWYQYAGSPWLRDPSKVNTSIDFLDESKSAYAFNLLLGHHGLFSLAPIWLLALAGMIVGIFRFARSERAGLLPLTDLSVKGDQQLRLVCSLAFVLTFVVVGFYIYKTNNYGGWTNGPRWLMWLTPLWLLAMIPIVDRMSERRWLRGLAYLFLVFSVLAANYRDWNPWRHPWIYNFLESQGWLGH